MNNLWTAVLLLVFACFTEVNGEENIWHLGIIYDETFAHTEKDIWHFLEDINTRIPHLLCAVLEAQVCQRLPKYKFTVGEYSLHEVCRQIELGVRSIISITKCATAKQIEATSSQYHIPHFAIPDASCTREELVSNVKEFAWANSELPWIVPAPEVLATALETIIRAEHISELLILSDGSSDIPTEILKRETDRLLSNKLATTISVQAFHTKVNCSDPISCPGQSFVSIVNQFKARNMTMGVNCFPMYIFIFATKCDAEEIIESINNYELMNEDFFWVLAEQTNVAPLLQRLKTPVGLPVDKFWKPNVAIIRRLPLIQTPSIATEFISNKTKFSTDLLRYTTEQLPERMVSIAFLVFESTRVYADIKRQHDHLLASKDIRCTTDSPTLFPAGVMLRERMNVRIKNSKVNQQLIFYATSTKTSSPDKPTQFIPTAVISDGNLTLTKSGKLILHESQKSGLFPNAFRGLHGRILRVGVVIDPPYVQKAEVTSDGQLINATGIMIDLTQLLAERFQFRPNFYEASDQQYGAADKSGNWSGLIRDLLTGRIDIAAAPLTFTEDRAKVIRYLGPFMASKTATLGAKLYANTSPFRMFHPFKGEMWLLLIISIFLTGVILFVLNYFSPFSAWNLGLPDSSEDEVSLQENIWSTLSSLLLQGCEVYPLAPCARSAIIFFWVMIVIFHATWQAFMTAAMSRSYVKLPIATLDELAYSQSIIPVVPEGSSITTAFSKAKHDARLQALYKRISDNRYFVKSAMEGVTLIQNDPQYIVIHDWGILYYIASQDCENLQILPIEFKAEPSGFAVAPGREFERPFSDYLKRLQETGAVHRTFGKWWFFSENCNNMEAQYRQITFRDVWGGAIILLLAMVLSVFVLGFENFYYRVLSRRIQECKTKRSVGQNPEVIEGDVIPAGPRRLSVSMLDALPETWANEFRYAGRRRTFCSQNTSTTSLLQIPQSEPLDDKK